MIPFPIDCIDGFSELIDLAFIGGINEELEDEEREENEGDSIEEF